MYGSKSLEELIVSYLQKELTFEEESYVIDLIKNNDEARLIFEEISETQRLLQINNAIEKLDVDSEWDTFSENFKNKRPKLISISDVSEVETLRLPQKSSFKSVFRYSAAASVILLLCWSGWMYNRSETNIKKVEKQAENIPAATPGTIWNKTVNSSRVAKEIKLEDGTLVVLESGSELSYPEHFPGNSRPLKLEGEAKFTVVKDAGRPLTIMTDFINTTVLGTVFSVRSYKHEKNIRVKLYEGKVVVTPEDTKYDDAKWYLIPGQELLYEKKNSTVAITKFRENKLVAKTKKNDTSAIKEMIEMPQEEKGNWFMFNNQSLPEVFDALELIYNSKIHYKKKDLLDLYFIGKYRKEDSLGNILDQITKIHGLRLEKNGNDFIIVK